MGISGTAGKARTREKDKTMLFIIVLIGMMCTIGDEILR